MIMGFCFRTAFWLYEPYFTHVGIEVAWFGAIFFGYNIVAALTAKYLAHRHDNQRLVLLGLMLLMAVSFLGPALIAAPWGIGVIGLQQIVRGIYKPVLNAYLNDQIEDQYRATVISVVGVAGSLSFALLSPLVGISLDAYGTLWTYAWMGAVMTAGMLVMAVASKGMKKDGSIR
jgi:MFS family permease